MFRLFGLAVLEALVRNVLGIAIYNHKFIRIRSYTCYLNYWIIYMLEEVG